MHQISFWFFQRGITPEMKITWTRKKCVSAFFPCGIHIWNFKTLACTVFDERRDNPKPICSRNFESCNFFEIGGHNKFCSVLWSDTWHFALTIFLFLKSTCMLSFFHWKDHQPKQGDYIMIITTPDRRQSWTVEGNQWTWINNSVRCLRYVDKTYSFQLKENV